MRIRRSLIAMFISVTLLVPCSSAWAGGEGQPPAGGISGPELWGVVVIDCTTDQGSLRVKTIDNCAVATDAFLGEFAICPATASDPVWYKLTGVTLSGMGITGTPIITKVKNFDKNESTSTVSFDALIRSTP